MIFSIPILNLKRLYLLQCQNVSNCILNEDWRPEERSNGFISARNAGMLQEVKTQLGRKIEHKTSINKSNNNTLH